MGEHESGIQRRLRGTEQRGEELYLFRDTVVCPKYRRRGVPISDLLATKNKGEKVRGLQSWTAENNVDLYLNKKPQALCAGDEFGAPVKSAKRRSV